MSVERGGPGIEPWDLLSPHWDNLSTLSQRHSEIMSQQLVWPSLNQLNGHRALSTQRPQLLSRSQNLLPPLLLRPVAGPRGLTVPDLFPYPVPPINTLLPCRSSCLLPGLWLMSQRPSCSIWIKQYPSTSSHWFCFIFLLFSFHYRLTQLICVFLCVIFFLHSRVSSMVKDIYVLFCIVLTALSSVPSLGPDT